MTNINTVLIQKKLKINTIVAKFVLKLCGFVRTELVQKDLATMVSRNHFSGRAVVDFISSIDNSAVKLCTFTSEISA
jgi:hypothetical protein